MGPDTELATLIRPSGYHNQKAHRLRQIARYIAAKHDSRITSFLSQPPAPLRRELLDLPGIGPETADSILLYALDRPTFVVDAYTARIICRHGLCGPDAGYGELKSLFEDNLPASARLFNEYHALIVSLGKQHCRPRAQCEGCPLEPFDHNRTAC